MLHTHTVAKNPFMHSLFGSTHTRSVVFHYPVTTSHPPHWQIKLLCVCTTHWNGHKRLYTVDTAPDLWTGRSRFPVQVKCPWLEGRSIWQHIICLFINIPVKLQQICSCSSFSESIKKRINRSDTHFFFYIYNMHTNITVKRHNIFTTICIIIYCRC